MLSDAAEKIGAGDLSDPIPRLGSDEVGRLGQALEAMRKALERSLDEVERANTQLEGRVDERTRELALLRTLGASRRRVLSMVVFDVVKLALPGVVAADFAFARFVPRFVFTVFGAKDRTSFLPRNLILCRKSSIVSSSTRGLLSTMM